MFDEAEASSDAQGNLDYGSRGLALVTMVEKLGTGVVDFFRGVMYNIGIGFEPVNGGA